MLDSPPYYAVNRSLLVNLPSGGRATIRNMWQVAVYCSDCAEEAEVVVEDLDEIEREACRCGYSFVVLSVAGFEPVHAEEGELVELSPRRDLPLAA